jgi:hypothetical protein
MFMTNSGAGSIGEFSTTIDPSVDTAIYAFSPDFYVDQLWGHIKPARSIGDTLNSDEAYLPIYQYYDAYRDAYRLSTDPALPELTRVRQEGFVYPPAEHAPGTTALYTWFCSRSVGDTYLTTTDPAWSPTSEHENCSYLSTEGNVFIHNVSGTVSLDAHVFGPSDPSEDPTTGKWFVAPSTTTAPGGYGLMRHNGYIRPAGTVTAAAPTFVRIASVEPEQPIELHPGETTHTVVHIERMQLSPEDAADYGFSTYDGPVTIKVEAVAPPMDPDEKFAFPEATVAGEVTIPAGATSGDLNIAVSPDLPDRLYDIYYSGTIAVMRVNDQISRLSVIQPIQTVGVQIVNVCGDWCPPKRPYYFALSPASTPDNMSLRFIARPSVPAETGYQVQYRVSGTSAWIDGATRGPATVYNNAYSYITQPGLALGTKYDFRIKVTSPAGTNLSKELSATTDAAWPLPGKPKMTPSVPCGKHATITVTNTSSAEVPTNFALYRGTSEPLALVKEWLNVKPLESFTVTDSSVPVITGYYTYHVKWWNGGHTVWTEPLTVGLNTTCSSGGSSSSPSPTGSPDLQITAMGLTWFTDLAMTTTMVGDPRYGYPYRVGALIANLGSVKAATSTTKWQFGKCTTSVCYDMPEQGFETDTPALDAYGSVYNHVYKYYTRIDGEVAEDNPDITGKRVWTCHADATDKIGDKSRTTNQSVPYYNTFRP